MHVENKSLCKLTVKIGGNRMEKIEKISVFTLRPCAAVKEDKGGR